jgi:hypothetical protein
MEKWNMKRQNKGLSFNTDSQWPIEAMEEKMGTLNKTDDHRDFGKPIPPVATAKVALASEPYHRAVAEMAYELWKNDGRLQNTSDANWFKAESALISSGSPDLSTACGDLGTNNTGKL